MRLVLERLDPRDEEHGAAWLSTDDGDSLEYEVGGNLCFTRADSDRHLPQVSTEKVLELWGALARGELDRLEEEPWQVGPRPPLTIEQEEARRRKLAAAQLASDRQFYDLLGPERASIPCRDAACTRGCVPLSVFCRRHHFESIFGRRCPFD
jgi:hypothetical protein